MDESMPTLVDLKIREGPAAVYSGKKEQVTLRKRSVIGFKGIILNKQFYQSMF